MQNVKIELNYATKTSNFAGKSHLASLKPEIDILNIGKLETTPVDLTKVSDVFKNEVVKIAVSDEFVKRVNAIQTTDTSNLVKRADYNKKIAEIEKKILRNDHDKHITTYY